MTIPSRCYLQDSSPRLARYYKPFIRSYSCMFLHPHLATHLTSPLHSSPCHLTSTPFSNTKLKPRHRDNRSQYPSAPSGSSPQTRDPLPAAHSSCSPSTCSAATCTRSRRFALATSPVCRAGRDRLFHLNRCVGAWGWVVGGWLGGGRLLPGVLWFLERRLVWGVSEEEGRGGEEGHTNGILI